MKLKWSKLSLLLLSLVPGVVWADHVLVVPVEGEQEDTGDLTGSLIELLKEGGDVVDRLDVSLKELRESFACENMTADCMSAAGAMWEADRLYFGQVERERD